jgi:2-amino-4-hydroxy-6-hydroxymethyldihydropteridine diphosphokinase
VTRAYVGLGSNLGDRAQTVLDAVDVLRAEEGVEVAGVSSLIETDPVGFLDQPRFVNGVAALDTTLTAQALLALLLEVEQRFGRSREAVPAQGPRTLDLDLLLYGDTELDEPGLRLPHPRLHERAFVLGPLAELAPGLRIPGHGPVEALLAAVQWAQDVPPRRP